MPAAPLLYRATEVADLLTVSRATVYRLIADGVLRACYPSEGCMRIRAEDVTAYIEKVTAPRPQDKPVQLHGRRSA